jgi:hypothetical protein
VYSTPGTYVASLTVDDDLGVNDPSPPTRTITVVQASSFTLSVTRQGTGSGTVTSSPGGINCGSTCSGTYTGGSIVTLTPTAAAGSRFDGWSGLADCTDGVVTVNQNTTCTATFTSVGTATLKVGRTGKGNGTITSNPTGITCGSDCSRAYPAGTQVQLFVNPAPGSVFDGWTGDADCADSIVTMTVSKTCKARFR